MRSKYFDKIKLYSFFLFSNKDDYIYLEVLVQDIYKRKEVNYE